MALSAMELQLEMLLIPNALCWSSWRCNCACALPAEVQLMRLRVTRRSWQKLFAGKNFVKILVTAQTQLRSYSEQQRVFGNSNICNWVVRVLADHCGHKCKKNYLYAHVCVFYTCLSSRSDHSRCRLYKHITNHGYFDNGKPHYPQLEPHAGRKTAPTSSIFGLNLWSVCGRGGTVQKALQGCATNMGSKIILLVYEWPLINCKIWYNMN